MTTRFIGVLIVTACAVSAATVGLAAAGAAAQASAKSVVSAARPGAMPSFAGEWRLDPAKSTRPQRPGGARGGPGVGRGPGVGGPGAGGPGVMREGGPGGGIGRGPAGPRNYLRIAQGGGLLTLSDSAGTALQEIAYEDPAPPVHGVRRFGGEWTGTSLVSLGERPRGGTVTETYSLRDQGGTLEIRTKIAADEERPEIEFVRVYRKVKTK